MASAVILAATACSPGSPAATVGRGVPTGPVAAIAFATTSFDLAASAGPLPGTTEGARAGIESTLNRWLEEGVVRPLRTGQPAGDIAPAFTAPARERIAATADRAAFVDEGLPPVAGLKAPTASLAMVALVDPTGNIPVVTVHVDMKLEGTVEGTPLSVARAADLVMLPDGDAWRIDGYDVAAVRSTPAATTVTTARA